MPTRRAIAIPLALLLGCAACIVDRLDTEGRPCGPAAPCGPDTVCGALGTCVSPGAASDQGAGDGAFVFVDGPRPDRLPSSDAAAGRELGVPCSTPDQCKSGRCVDGVCCDGLCSAPCRSCALTGRWGSCSVEPTGAACGAASCKDTLTLNLPRTCDEKGACQGWGTKDCRPYRCDTAASACATVCFSDVDCTTDHKCKGQTCLKQVGAACAKPSECHSGYCIDGACCSTECSGLCEHCNLGGKTGTCSLVPAGQDPDNDCSQVQVSSCGQDGACDGKGACRLWAAKTICDPGTCNAKYDRIEKAKGCDGQGHCSVGLAHQDCPNNFTCDPTTDTCYTSCSSYTQCGGAWSCDTTTKLCFTTCTNDSQCKPSDDCENKVCEGD